MAFKNLMKKKKKKQDTIPSGTVSSNAGKAKSGLESVLNETKNSNSFDMLKENREFICGPDNRDYAVLVLDNAALPPANKINDKKNRNKNDAVGDIVKAINDGFIHTVTTPDTLSEDKLVIIPDPTTLSFIDQFEALKNPDEYPFTVGLVNNNMDLIETGIPITYDEAMQIVEQGMSIQAKLEGFEMPDDSLEHAESGETAMISSNAGEYYPDEEDESAVLPEDESVADDMYVGDIPEEEMYPEVESDFDNFDPMAEDEYLEPIPQQEQPSFSMEPESPEPEPALEPGFEPIPQPARKNSYKQEPQPHEIPAELVKEPEPAPIQQPAAEPVHETQPAPAPQPEPVMVPQNEVYKVRDIEIVVPPTSFDAILNESQPMRLEIPDEGSWTSDEIANATIRYNSDLENFHQKQIERIKSELMQARAQMITQEIMPKYDYFNPENSYGKDYKKLEKEYSENRKQAAYKIDTAQQDIEAKYENELEEVITQAQETARNNFVKVHEPEKERKKRSVQEKMYRKCEDDFNLNVFNLKEAIRHDAAVRFNEQENAIRAIAGKALSDLEAQEQKLYEKYRKDLAEKASKEKEIELRKLAQHEKDNAHERETAALNAEYHRKMEDSQAQFDASLAAKDATIAAKTEENRTLREQSEREKEALAQQITALQEEKRQTQEELKAERKKNKKKNKKSDNPADSQQAQEIALLKAQIKSMQQASEETKAPEAVQEKSDRKKLYWIITVGIVIFCLFIGILVGLLINFQQSRSELQKMIESEPTTQIQNDGSHN